MLESSRRRHRGASPHGCGRPALSAADEPLIRLVRDDEIEAVGRLVVSAYSSAYDLNPRYRAELAAVRERAGSQQVWVAVDRGGELLGTVTTPLPGARINAFSREGDMDLRMLAVPPAARGRGVAKALMRHCMRLGRERGATRLIFHTGDDMHLAVALYERMGFERVVEIERDFPYPPGVWYPVRVYSMPLD